MAPALATNRLRKELINLKKDPPPGVLAEPNEADILSWHYCIQGPKDTHYEGGAYVGKIKFPPEYPLKPPSIYMLTPSGRFQCNTKLCMSMSDFHPESWNPMWSVATIIQGIQSFMASEELTTGGMMASDADRRKLASVSMAFNAKTFPNLFGGDIEAAFEASNTARLDAAKNKVIDEPSTRGRRSRIGRVDSMRNQGAQQDGQDEGEDDEKQGEATEEIPSQVLSPEELEKRRKRNAKKRARQKAKKAALASDDGAALADRVLQLTVSDKVNEGGNSVGEDC